MPKRNAGDDLVDRGPGTTCVSKCFPFSRLRHRGEMSALLTNRPSPARNWKLKSGSQPVSCIFCKETHFVTANTFSWLSSCPSYIVLSKKKKFQKQRCLTRLRGIFVSKTMQFKVGVVNRSGCFFRCTMCPAFIQPDLSAACETPVLHGSQNLLEKSTQEIFSHKSQSNHFELFIFLYLRCVAASFKTWEAVEE